MMTKQEQEAAQKKWNEIRDNMNKRGVNLSLDEINEEISIVRNERMKKQKGMMPNGH